MENEPAAVSATPSREELLGGLNDVLTVGEKGVTAHRPSGEFMNNYELEQIAAHQDQIRDGLDKISEDATRAEAQPETAAQAPAPVDSTEAAEETAPSVEIDRDTKYKPGQSVKMSMDGKLAESGWVVDTALTRNREGLPDPDGKDVYYALRHPETGRTQDEVHEQQLDRYQSLPEEAPSEETDESVETSHSREEVAIPERPEPVSRRSWAEMIDLVGGADLPDDVKGQLQEFIKQSPDYQTERREADHEAALKINELFDKLAAIDDEIEAKMEKRRREEAAAMREVFALNDKRKELMKEFDELYGSDSVIDVVVEGEDDAAAEEESNPVGVVARIKHRAKRIVNRAKQALYMAPVRLGGKLHIAARHEGETDEQYEKRARRKTVALGIAIVALGAGGFYLASRGHANPSDGLDLSDGNNLTPDNSEMPPLPEPPPASPEAPPVEFGPAAYAVDPGEGWFQTFKDMGIPNEEWGPLLNKVGPQLQDSGWAYWDGAHNNWGISRPGTLPQDMLDLINNSR